MYLKDAKVYNDGSHYIAIAHTTRPKKHGYKPKEKEYVLDNKGKVIKECLEPITETTTKGYVLTEVKWNKENNQYEPIM